MDTLEGTWRFVRAMARDEAWFEIGSFWVTRAYGNRRLTMPDAGLIAL